MQGRGDGPGQQVLHIDALIHAVGGGSAGELDQGGRQSWSQVAMTPSVMRWVPRMDSTVSTSSRYAAVSRFTGVAAGPDLVSSALG